jgi:hypothetical protein
MNTKPHYSDEQSLVRALGLGSVTVVEVVGSTIKDTQMFVVERIVLSNGMRLMVDDYHGMCVVEDAAINAEDMS